MDFLEFGSFFMLILKKSRLECLPLQQFLLRLILLLSYEFRKCLKYNKPFVDFLNSYDIFKQFFVY